MAGAVACRVNSRNRTVDGGIQQGEEAAVAYRFWCGECGYKSDWGSESQGERQQIEHYAARHPGTPPGGQVEVNRKDPEGGACLPVVLVAIVLLILLASCHH